MCTVLKQKALFIAVFSFGSVITNKKAYNKNKCPTSGEQLIRYYTKFDFTVDEGTEWLNPSREKN